MLMRILVCGLLLFASFPPLLAQPTLTEAEKVAICKKASQVVRGFFDVVERLAANDIKDKTKKILIKTVVEDYFLPEGTVEEKASSSKKGLTRSIRNYLNVIAGRGQKSPILVNYEVVDNLTPNKLKPKTNQDGSISYEGKLRVRQFYCKLKPSDQLSDDLTGNCAYSDTTIKEATIAIRRGKSNHDAVWEVFILNITVISVTKN